MRKKHICLLLLALLPAIPAAAQRLSLSTNVLDWANLGTANLQAGFSLERRISLHAGLRYNNWSFGSAEQGSPFQNRARTASAGMRYWPWNVYSSWWAGARAQVEEYNRGGFLGHSETEEGLAWGLALAMGYSWLFTDHWNIDFGIGFWGGRTRYTLYRCPRCGRIVSDDEGRPIQNAWKWFVLPSNEIQVSLTYIF